MKGAKGETVLAYHPGTKKAWEGPREKVPAGYVVQPPLFPFAVPEDANLRGLKDGTALTEEQIREVCGWEDYPDEWAVLPLSSGGYVLRWADGMTTAELERSTRWHERETVKEEADHAARKTQRGSA